MKRTALLTLALLFTASGAMAEKQPSPGSTDSRVQTVVYHERDVVKITGHYGFQTLIRFADYEVIENISIGDSLAWQVVPNERRNLLFIKPIEKDADTNMTVVTAIPTRNAEESPFRVYNFSMRAKRSTKHTDPRMTWTVQFHYPQDDVARLQSKHRHYQNARNSLVLPDEPSANPENWNFNYTFAGSDAQAPVRIFDNGEFTFFEFDKHTDIPAIFLVDENRNESLLNGNPRGKYIVVHRTGRQFTLRNGERVTCVFNEDFKHSPSFDVNSPTLREGKKQSSAQKTNEIAFLSHRGE